MGNLLIILGSVAALSGLAWLGYVGSVMRGSKGNAIIGGISAAVVGSAVIVLGTSISDEPETVQQFFSDDTVFAAPTALPEPTPTPSPSSTPAVTASPSAPAVETSASPLPTQPQPSVARLDEPPATPAAVPLDVAGPPPAVDVAAVRSAAAAVPVRITELLPDPLEPGPDAEFEWVELTNLGAEPVSLEGLQLRDNAGAVALPAITLPPGASIVFGGRLVRLEAVLVVQLADGISLKANFFRWSMGLLNF